VYTHIYPDLYSIISILYVFVWGGVGGCVSVFVCVWLCVCVIWRIVGVGSGGSGPPLFSGPNKILFIYIDQIAPFQVFYVKFSWARYAPPHTILDNK
jgi:hypothetical protein